ncbi:MAG: CoB--CoM heterodisulfide reductase iron-sulfur subunit B family protein [Anaerolineae bacterium]|nr:CoB--CoM heterodisulfide reductase iron-sulfur subunit B family protein [Anaerolineae bacterium]
MTDTYAYYPGCSLHATGKEFHQSTEAVFEALGAPLRELEDWNCCGASSAHAVNPELTLALPARNLALAQRQGGGDVVMPCAACFNRHKAADIALRTDEQKRARLEQIVEFTFDGSAQVRTLIDVIYNDIGLDRVRAQVKRPLNGLRVVAYYGCLLVRPKTVNDFDDPEHPVVMGRILAALGAEVRPYAYTTECCGGALSLTAPKSAARMVNRLVGYAREAGAEAMAVSCPLCQINLEMRQSKGGPRMPIFYVTELMGLAFDLPGAAQWQRMHLIDPKPVLDGIR